jgi:starch synthase (maltosyl-transferring)
LQTRCHDQTQSIQDACRTSELGSDADPLLSEDLEAVARKLYQSDLTRSATYPLRADRPIASAGAWYEMMPRSQSPVSGRHGTFNDCIKRLPDIAALGFHVLYLTPAHPIGRTNRKGRNNSLRAKPGDPGSPYAIGSAEGGHDAVHLELGTLDDFRRLVQACADHGLEVALDFAVQCSLDHPWLAQHPEWFRRRADGSIQYAEPPRRNTKTSSIRTSPAPTVRRFGRPCATW